MKRPHSTINFHHWHQSPPRSISTPTLLTARPPNPSHLPPPLPLCLHHAAYPAWRPTLLATANAIPQSGHAYKLPPPRATPFHPSLPLLLHPPPLLSVIKPLPRPLGPPPLTLLLPRPLDLQRHVHQRIQEAPRSYDRTPNFPIYLLHRSSKRERRRNVPSLALEAYRLRLGFRQHQSAAVCCRMMDRT